jgi:DNA-binding beta-propeller fold protein YncE
MRPNVRFALAAVVVFVALTSSCNDSAAPDRPGPPTDIAISAGDAQTGAAGSTLAAPIAAKVSDAKGRGVPNIAVTFQVIGTIGSVNPTVVRTNGAGIAATSWTLATIAGSIARVRAVLVDTLSGALVDSVTFSATIVGGHPPLWVGGAPPDAAPTGSGQVPSVTLYDSYGNYSVGTTVNWTVTSGGGTVTPASSVTDLFGVANTAWTLGTAAGTNRLTAHAGSLTGNFVVEGRVPGTAKSMIAGSYPPTAAFGASVPLSVTVYDAFNAPVVGATVNWVATSGGGSLSAPSSVTDGSGVATVTATLGNTGYNVFTATSGSAAASFVIETPMAGDRLTTLDGAGFGIARTAGGNVVVALIYYGRVETFPESSPSTKHLIPVGGTPVVVAVDAAGAFAYVSNMGGWLDIIDLGTNTEVQQVPVPDAHALAISPAGDRVYVTTTTGKVVAVSTTTRKVVGQVAVPNGPWGIAFRSTATDSLMYVTSRDGGTVTEVDTKTLTVKRVFSIDGRPHGLAISPNGQTLYAADNSLGRIVALSTASGAITGTLRLPGAFGIAISPDGSTLYATTDGARGAAIDAASLTVTKFYDLGDDGRQLVVEPDGASALSANTGGWVDIIRR